MSSQTQRWVSKFGGTSLANAGQIRKVKDIISADTRRRVVVVSAPGKEHREDEKITDLLYSCHRLSISQKSFDEPFNTIQERFLAIARELKVGKTIETELEEIYERIPQEKTPDYAASRGEYLCAMMMAEYLGGECVDAKDVIFLTSDGQVDPVSYIKTAEALSRQDTLYILPGFYGTDPNGRIKCFTRGGSDISGAIAARSVHADLYENWTDVSGILMADPRIVEDPQVIKEITYREIRELASIGANVFHEEAIAPVRKAGIPIQIKNTNDPEAPGTRITSNRKVTQQPIVGVSGKLPYRRIIIEKFMLNRYADFPAKVSGLIPSLGIKPDVTISGFDAITLYADTRLIGDVFGMKKIIIKELDADACEISESLALIGIVGEGIAVKQDLLELSLNALKKEAVIPVSVTSGNSPLSMLICVLEEDYAKALTALTNAAG